MIDSNCLICFLEMVKSNIFRAMPTIPLKPIDAIDVSWPHLKLVYACLKKSLMFKYYSNISKNFLYNLFKNIVSLDKRERNSVKEIIIEMFTKFNSLQKPICDCLQSFLSIDLYSNELFQLICTLDLLDSDFYIKFILPIHLSSISYMYPSIIDCDLLFCKFDIDLFPFLLQYLLNHWPITESKKQLFYLKIICKIFENFIKFVSIELSDAFFDVVSLCIRSDSIDTTKYALELVSTPLFTQIYSIADKSNFEKLYESISIEKMNWDETVRLDAFDSMLVLSHLDRNQFHKSSLKRNHDIIKKESTTMDERWKLVLNMARRRYKTINIHYL